MQKDLNKNSFVPIYFQLAQILEQQILSGELKPGDLIPSENDLASKYDVSRMTVRKCINVLAERGLVTAQRGKGTFVSRLALDRAVFVVDEFHQEMQRRGLKAESRLIATRVKKANQEILEKLELNDSDRVLYFCRLLIADGRPIGLEQKYLRFNKGRPILENELQYKAFSEVISSHSDALPVRSRMILKPGVIDQEEASLLQVPLGSPVYHMEQFLYSYDDVPLGWSLYIFRGDQFALVSEVRPLKGVE